MLKWSTRLGLLVIVVVAGAVVFSSSRRAKTTPRAQDDVSVVAADETPATPSDKVTAPRPIDPPSVRRRVREAADRVAESTTADQLPAYLDELLARARTRGEVTAFEAELGRDLIKRYGADVQTEMRFVAKLNDLARELRHDSAGSTPPKDQTLAALDATTDQLTAEQDPGKRRELVRQYMDQAATLDPEQQARKMSQLNKLMAPPAVRAPTAADLDAQVAAIQAAPSEGRQPAIESFIEKVHQLPPDQRIVQMRRLNSLAPPSGIAPAAQ